MVSIGLEFLLFKNAQFSSEYTIYAAVALCYILRLQSLTFITKVL